MLSGHLLKSVSVRGEVGTGVGGKGPSYWAVIDNPATAIVIQPEAFAYLICTVIDK